MPCIISDAVGYRNPDGTFTGLPGQQVLAVPSSPNLTTDVGGTWYPLNGLNPNVTGSLVYKYGTVATTDASGVWSITLPYGATETHPAIPEAKWSLVFPDGSILTGSVPSTAGPVTVDDLIGSYGWVWAAQIYIAPVTAGTFAKGTATFSLSGTATIVFLTPFVDNTYQIELTPSVDTVDGTIPRVAWANKTTTGFDVVLDTTGYSGSVDWEAQL